MTSARGPQISYLYFLARLQVPRAVLDKYQTKGSFSMCHTVCKSIYIIFKLAADVTNSCHESYDRSATKLGPESFRFDLGGDREATQSRPNDAYYILR